MNFVTKEKIVKTDNYVIESWFDEQNLQHYFDTHKNQDFSKTHFYIIGRDIKTFHTWKLKLNLLKKYNIKYTFALPERNGKDRNYKNILALKKFLNKDETFMILTDRLHSQRSYYLAKKIFTDNIVGIEYFKRVINNFDSATNNKEEWYKNSESLKATIMEFIALIYSIIKYR